MFLTYSLVKVHVDAQNLFFTYDTQFSNVDVTSCNQKKINTFPHLLLSEIYNKMCVESKSEKKVIYCTTLTNSSGLLEELLFKPIKAISKGN